MFNWGFIKFNNTSLEKVLEIPTTCNLKLQMPRFEKIEELDVETKHRWIKSQPFEGYTFWTYKAKSQP